MAGAGTDRQDGERVIVFVERDRGFGNEFSFDWFSRKICDGVF
jgi:hypothetical protein